MAGERWIDTTGDTWRLRLRLQPAAKVSRVVGVHGDRLKIAITAPAVDGRANAALIKWLSDALGLPQKSLEMTAGFTSRDKQVLLRCAGQTCMAHKLLAMLSRQ